MDPLGAQGRSQRASLYVRLSNEASATNTSLASMIGRLREICTEQGWDEVALHVDDGLSGAIRNRPEFVAWLDDARHGRCDVLLAYHVDRMTREGLNVAALILDVVEGKDPVTGRVVRPPVRLKDAKGLDSADGVAFRMMFLIRAEVAREERERIKDRLRGKSGRLRLVGRWPGGEVPFGYRSVEAADGVGKTLDVHPEEAEALRECASRLLDGHTLGRTVRWLNQHGPAPRRAKEWSRMTLGQSLTGDHILGRVTIEGVLQRGSDGRPVAPFPAVLDLPTVLELRKLLERSPDARKRAGRYPSRLLSRLIECSGCGDTLQVVRRAAYRTVAERDRDAAGRAAIVAYRCQRRADGGICDRPVVASAVPLEEYVSERFLSDFGHVPMVERRVTMADDVELAEVEEEIAHVLASLGSAATPENFSRLLDLQARRDVLAAAPREPVVQLTPTGRTMGEEWAARDLEGKRELLGDAYVVLALGPGRPGRRGFDPARLTAIPAEGVHDPD